MGSMYGQIFGYNKDHYTPAPGPNRAQRRARDKHDRAVQKRGQKAFEASQAKLNKTEEK